MRALLVRWLLPGLCSIFWISPLCAQACYLPVSRNMYESALLNQVLDAARGQRKSVVCRLGTRLHDEYQLDLDDFNNKGCQSASLNQENLMSSLASTLQSFECE